MPLPIRDKRGRWGLGLGTAAGLPFVGLSQPQSQTGGPSRRKDALQICAPGLAALIAAAAEAEFYSGGKRRSGILGIANSRFRQASLRAVKPIAKPIADSAGHQESGQRLGCGVTR
jgi:hypothetical protein